MSSTTLPLVEAPSLGTSLPNYDTDRDGDEGLLVKKGDGVGESDAQKRQWWTIDLGERDLAGPAQFRIRAAIKDYDNKEGEFGFAIQRCNASLSSCSTLVDATKTFNQDGGGDFQNVVVNTTLSAGTTAAQPVLRLIVAAHNNSDDDLWFAYDTTEYPSRLILQQN